MSSWSLDLIPRRDGESVAEAIDRVYPGFIDDETEGPTADGIAVLIQELAPVTRAVRAWMVAVVEQLQALDVGLEIVHTECDPGRRWPHLIRLVSERAQLMVDVDSTCLCLRPHGHPETDEHWRLWWRVVRSFACKGYVACFPDGMDVWRASVSQSAKRARAEAALF